MNVCITINNNITYDYFDKNDIYLWLSGRFLFTKPEVRQNIAYEIINYGSSEFYHYNDLYHHNDHIIIKTTMINCDLEI